MDLIARINQVLMHKTVVVFAAFCMLILTSCDPARVYEQNIDFAKGEWAVENAPVFEFEIQDTTKKYDVYFNVRYNLQYNFYNLYVQHQLIGPDSTLISSNLHELLLMDSKTGKPLGKGFSDTFDLQARALKGVTFSESGLYRIKLTQYMRQDPLPNVFSMGVRVSSHQEK